MLASLTEQDLLTKYALRSRDLVGRHMAINLGARIAAATVSKAGATPPWLEKV